MSHDDMKSALKEALKEWLDEKCAEFGRWTLRWLFAASFAALIYFILKTNGWSFNRDAISIPN